jgi:hypothetical protein
MNKLEISFSCPICGKKYDKHSVHVVSEKDDGVLIHICCGFCEVSSLAVLPKKGSPDGMSEGIATVGTLTDLNYDEACELLQEEPISADEVLDVYKSGKIN